MSTNSHHRSRLSQAWDGAKNRVRSKSRGKPGTAKAGEASTTGAYNVTLEHERWELSRESKDVAYHKLYRSDAAEIAGEGSIPALADG